MKYIKPRIRIVYLQTASLVLSSGSIESGGPVGGGDHQFNGAKDGFFDEELEDE